MPRGSCLGLVLAACLALNGCAPRATYKYRIAVIPKGLTHEFWQSIHRGARRAAADLGAEGLAVEVLWEGPAKESDALEQINLIERKTASGVHGLVLAPQDSKQMVRPVQDSVSHGVPVVIIDSNLDKEALQKQPDLIVKYVATNNYHGGELAAKHLLEVLAREGKPAPRLVLLRYQVGSESTDQREQGFLDYVHKAIEDQKKAGQPTITLVSTDKYAGATVDTAEKEANNLLIRLRDEGIDGIFAVNESAAVGTVNALRSQGLNGKIRLMGFDSSGPLLQALRKGDVIGLIVQDPYRMGYLGVWTLVKHLDGYDVAADGKERGTGENLVTRDNLDDEQTRALFEPALQEKRAIETPTYKKRTKEDR